MAEPAPDDMLEAVGNAEARSAHSLSYWQLVRRRFVRNIYGMIGLFGCLLIFFVAIFAGFVAPYGPSTSDKTVLYTPPQMIKIIDPDGGLAWPFVTGFSEEMDPNTFEITFGANIKMCFASRFLVWMGSSGLIHG